MTRAERRKAAEQHCRSMTNDDLRALLASPSRRITKALREVAQWVLQQRESAQRAEFLRGLTDEELRTVMPTDMGSEISLRGERGRRKQARQEATRKATRKITEAARRQFENVETEKLLAFNPDGATVAETRGGHRRADTKDGAC